MPKLLGFACLLLMSCHDHQFENNFFNHSRPEQLALMRQYPLEEQYKLFHIGMHKPEQVHFDLAIPIAERGASAVPFLTEHLRASSDEATLHDILFLFAEMKRLKTFDAGRDPVLMEYFVQRVAQMKINSGFNYPSRMWLEEIKQIRDNP